MACCSCDLSRHDSCKVFWVIALLCVCVITSIGLLAGLNGPEVTVTRTYIATTCNFSSSAVVASYATSKTCGGCQEAQSGAPSCSSLNTDITNLSPAFCAAGTGPCPPASSECDDGSSCCLQVPFFFLFFPPCFQWRP